MGSRRSPTRPTPGAGPGGGLAACALSGAAEKTREMVCIPCFEVADKPQERRVSVLRPSLSCLQQSPFSLRNRICEFS